MPNGLRQDKTVSNVATFALKTFADFINAIKFREVSTIDAHSNVAEKLINNFVNIDPNTKVHIALEKSKAISIA